jgi:hypothetical protein
MRAMAFPRGCQRPRPSTSNGKSERDAPASRQVACFNAFEWKALKKMSEKTGDLIAELTRRPDAEWVAKKK